MLAEVRHGSAVQDRGRCVGAAEGVGTRVAVEEWGVQVVYAAIGVTLAVTSLLVAALPSLRGLDGTGELATEALGTVR